jgi:hypothetical protein
VHDEPRPPQPTHGKASFVFHYCVCCVWRCGARGTGASTYKSDYPSHPICPHHGPVPLQWAPSGVPFQGTSEMRAQYTPKAFDPAALGAAGGSTGEAPSRPRIPFEGAWSC